VFGRIAAVTASVGFGIVRSPRIVGGATTVGFGLVAAVLASRAAVIVSVEFGVAGLAKIGPNGSFSVFDSGFVGSIIFLAKFSAILESATTFSAKSAATFGSSAIFLARSLATC
jgi:hypothetical protein